MLRGVAASPGVAAGAGLRIADCGLRPDGGLRSAEDALGALEATALRFEELAASAEGAEAEILAASAMMARDPALGAAVEAEARLGTSPRDALLRAAETFALQLEAIDDPTLAARAEDVRSIGRR